MTNSDDDYCVSYTVTMVDVRSCTRPSRLPHQTHQGTYTHTVSVVEIRVRNWLAKFLKIGHFVGY